MRNPFRALGEALSAAGEQDPETRVRQGATSYSPGSVDEIPAPKDLADDYEFYRETPFINAALHQFASDVVESGYRVEADSDETADWFNDEFLEQAGVVAGERNQDFALTLYQSVIQHEAAGNILVEKVKQNPNESDPTYTGFMHIRPESVKLVTEENRPLLIDPDATDRDEVVLTKRGEAAAYLQYHEGSLLGQRDYYSGRDVVPLSTNDVIKVARAPVPGEVWGDSVLHSVRDLVRGLKQILRDNEQAIQSKAYGIWSVAFESEVRTFDGYHEPELVEWDGDAQSDFLNNQIGSEMGPGDIVGHDGNISFEKFEGEVADELLDVIELYVKLIVTALPTPLYAVGLESNINQFVTAEQETRYDKRVRDLRQDLEQAFTPALKEIAEQQGYSPEGLQLRLEPEEDESPIHALDDGAMDRLSTFTTALKNVYGNGGATSYLDEEALAELVLQLPADAIAEDDIEEIRLDESDPEVQAQFESQQGEEGPPPPGESGPQQAVADGGEQEAPQDSPDE